METNLPTLSARVYVNLLEGSIYWLVVLTILKNMSQWEGWHPIYEMENKNHVWNHQPEPY